jgi:hypothetical protein
LAISHLLLWWWCCWCSAGGGLVGGRREQWRYGQLIAGVLASLGHCRDTLIEILLDFLAQLRDALRNCLGVALPNFISPAIFNAVRADEVIFGVD